MSPLQRRSVVESTSRLNEPALQNILDMHCDAINSLGRELATVKSELNSLSYEMSKSAKDRDDLADLMKFLVANPDAGIREWAQYEAVRDRLFSAAAVEEEIPF